MDPNLLLPTQCFLVRDRLEHAIAILEVPKTAALPDEAIKLVQLIRYNVDDHYSYAEWNNAKEQGDEIRVEFRWDDWICDNAADPSSMGPILHHCGRLTLEPMGYNNALEAAVLGHLDYYRTKKIGKISNTMSLDIESVYIGKLEPDGDEVCFPGFPVEPMDSHIVPNKRLSKQCPQENSPKQLMESSEAVEFTEA